MSKRRSRRKPHPHRGDLRRSLQFQVLGTINLILIISLSLFLLTKYRSDLNQRLIDRRQSLHNDASMLSPILLRLHHQPRRGTDDENDTHNPVIQRIIDITGLRMQEQSRGYLIVASVADRIYEAQSANDIPSDSYRLMVHAEQTPEGIMEIGKRLMLVGSSTSGDITVYVAENVADVMREARGDLYFNLIAMGCFGLAVTAALNLILIHLVIQPLHNLAETARKIGRGDLDARVDAGRTSEFRTLAREINSMTRQLADAEKQRVREFEKAHQIQKNLAPDPEDAQFLGITIRHQPATEVTGDYYDVTPLGPDRTLVAVADVTGHGVPAALEASMLKTLFDIARLSTHEPGAILELINKPFTRVSLDEDFASMFALYLDKQTQEVRYASAGHEPAYLLRANGELHLMPSTGPLLGILAGATWATRQLPAQTGDRIVIVTDGLAETMNARSELLTRRVIENALVDMARVPSANLCKQLINIADHHRGSPNPMDDITLVVVTV